MWLPLDTNLQYRFDGNISPASFFAHLPLILAPADILVLGCYDARSDIQRFLASESLPATWKQFHSMEAWDHNRKEHPNGRAFHLHPTMRVLRQLIGFAESVPRHIDLCDHLAGYGAERPIFIYHGAFQEPLFVSTNVPLGSVEAFSRGIAVTFEIIDFDATYQS